jgi:hypothetical protein
MRSESKTRKQKRFADPRSVGVINVMRFPSTTLVLTTPAFLGIFALELTASALAELRNKSSSAPSMTSTKKERELTCKCCLHYPRPGAHMRSSVPDKTGRQSTASSPKHPSFSRGDLVSKRTGWAQLRLVVA